MQQPNRGRGGRGREERGRGREGPNVRGGNFGHNDSEGNFGPNCSGGNFGPNSRGDNFGPNNRGGNFGPNNRGGNCGPNTRGGNFGPNTRGGNSGPNGRGGNFGHNDSEGNFGPNCSGGNFGPNSRGDNFGPNNRGGNFGPNNRGGNCGPNTRGGNFGPNTRGGNFGPNTRGGNFGPNTRGGNCGPNNRGGNFGPNTRGGNFGPNTRGGNCGPNSRGGSFGANDRGSSSERYGILGEFSGSGWDGNQGPPHGMDGNQQQWNQGQPPPLMDFYPGQFQAPGLLPTPMNNNGPTKNMTPAQGSYLHQQGRQQPVIVQHTTTIVNNPSMMPNLYNDGYPDNLSRSSGMQSLDVGSNRGARPKQNRRDSSGSAQRSVPITQEVTVPFKFHGHIIGPKGSNISKLNDEHDVTISCPPRQDQSDIIKVTGLPANISRAKEALAEKVKYLEKEDKLLKSHEFTMEVDPKYHALLIGKGGAVISKIRTNHDVRIYVPERKAANQSSIRIVGYKKSCEEARDEILNIVREHNSQDTSLSQLGLQRGTGNSSGSTRGAAASRGNRNTSEGSRNMQRNEGSRNMQRNDSKAGNDNRYTRGRARGRRVFRGRNRGRGGREFEFGQGRSDDGSEDDNRSVDSRQSARSECDFEDVEEEPRFGNEGGLRHHGNMFGRGAPFRQSLRNTRGQRSFRVKGRGRFATAAQRSRGKDNDAENDSDEDDDGANSSMRSSSPSSVISDNATGSVKSCITTDDIHSISVVTLQNRIKRYRRKITEMQKGDDSKEDEIQTLEVAIAEIRGEIENREKKNRKKKKNKTKLEEFEKLESNDISEDESDSDSDSGTLGSDSDSDSARKSRLAQVYKRMNTVSTKKGNISFRPKLMKASQAAAKKLKAQSDKLDGVPHVAKVKETSKATQKKDKMKATALETVENSDEVLEEIDSDDGSVKETKSRSKRRQRGKTKKSQNDEVKADGEIDDLLNQFDDICLPVSAKPVGQGKIDHDNRSADSVNDLNNSGKKSQSKGKNDAPASNKKAQENKQKHMEDMEPDVNDVFKFLVKQLNGKGTPEEIMRESGLFPNNFDIYRWLKRFATSRFTIIEKDGNIVSVMVFDKNATYCLDYIMRKSCTKTICPRYHICKDLLCGHCSFGERCRRSHDFLDESSGNLAVSKQLGYNNVFTSDEICSILKVRFPHVCNSWNETGSCTNENCLNLHYCPRYVQNKCLEGEVCLQIHDKLSAHNKWIVNAFGMGKWDDNLFGRIVYIKRTAAIESRSMNFDTTGLQDEGRRNRRIFENARETMNDGEPSAHTVKPSSRRNRVVFDDVTVEPNVKAEQVPTEKKALPKREKRIPKGAGLGPSADSDKVVTICDLQLAGKCRNKNCNILHDGVKIPYIWQVKLYGNWETMNQSEAIEKQFCAKEEYSAADVTPENFPDAVKLIICFEPNIHAFLGDGTQMIEARRLSTASFRDAPGDVEAGSYKTQWRWFWMDDFSRWIMFEPDALQYTLESKYLADQKEYLYSRENYRFKYLIDFSSMAQYNLDTQKVRVVRRRPILVTASHVAMGEFPTSLGPPPSVDVALPESWMPWDLAHPFELVTLSPQSKTYTEVESNFYKTLSQQELAIDRVYRVQNHTLWSLFCNKEKSMKAASERAGLGSVLDKRQLFHGTDSLDAVRGISVNNVDNRVSGKNATAYGDGAYFAKEAKYSHMYTGKNPKERFMFQASVIVGQFTRGDKTYRRPPPRQGHELYDTCVNSMSNPTIFVVFDRNQYYPEFLIQYHEVVHLADLTYQPASSSSAYTSPSSSGVLPQTPSSPLRQTQTPPPLPSHRSRSPTSYPSSSVFNYPSSSPTTYPTSSPTTYPTSSPTSYPTSSTTHPSSRRRAPSPPIQVEPPRQPYQPSQSRTYQPSQTPKKDTGCSIQ